MCLLFAFVNLMLQHPNEIMNRNYCPTIAISVVSYSLQYISFTKRTNNINHYNIQYLIDVAILAGGSDCYVEC